MYRMPASNFRRAASRVYDPRPRTPEPLSLKRCRKISCSCREVCREVLGGRTAGAAARRMAGEAVRRALRGGGRPCPVSARGVALPPACQRRPPSPGLRASAHVLTPAGPRGEADLQAGVPVLFVQPHSRAGGGGGGQVECPPLCSCTVRVRRQQTSGHG